MFIDNILRALSYIVLSIFAFFALKLKWDHYHNIDGPFHIFSIIYSFSSIYFILRIINNFSYFGINGIQIANLISPVPGPYVFFIIVISITFIQTAFLFNLSRSFLILNQLEFAVFEDSPELNKLLIKKRLFEIVPRALCAMAFLYFEYIFYEAGKLPRFTAESILDMTGAGVFLYLFLLTWWAVNKLYFKLRDLGWNYFVLFVCGLFISLFIQLTIRYFRERTETLISPVLLIIFCSINCIWALIMILIIGKKAIHYFKRILLLVFAPWGNKSSSANII